MKLIGFERDIRRAPLGSLVRRIIHDELEINRLEREYGEKSGDMIRPYKKSLKRLYKEVSDREKIYKK